MSELRPRSELRSKNGVPKLEGIARHGRLKKSNPFPTIFKFIAAAIAVVLVSGVSVGALAVNSIVAKAPPGVELVQPTEGPVIGIGAAAGGFNILIVGSDTRSGQDGIGGSEEDESASLNDVNMLLHVSQDRTSAVAVSFPRDMVVGIPECPWDDGSGDVKGYSTEALNTALYYGGLNCVAMTISALTGLPISYAGEITFNGVIAMSDAIGGVPVCVDGPMIDENTGLVLGAAGNYTLKGIDALAFLRSRAAVGDGSDLTRISSQQVYLSSLVRTLKSSATLSDLGKVYNLADAAISNMQLSTSLNSVPTMVSIALALKDIPLENVTFVQYPGTTGQTEGVYAGKVRPNEVVGDELMALIASDQPFQLAGDGDSAGAAPDPNAPAADPNAPVVDTSGQPVIDATGTKASDYKCTVTNSY